MLKIKGIKVYFDIEFVFDSQNKVDDLQRIQCGVQRQIGSSAQRLKQARLLLDFRDNLNNLCCMCIPLSVGMIGMNRMNIPNSRLLIYG